MNGPDIAEACKARRWTRTRLVLELRTVGRARGTELPEDSSLKRMIREWVSGRRGLSSFYADLLTGALGLPFHPSTPAADGESSELTNGDGELRHRLETAASVDSGLIRLLEDLTESYRALDRRLGAKRILAQTEQHVSQITDLLAHSLINGQRRSLAAAAAEAAALAGWQALDQGDASKAWHHHESAKTAARESGSAAILAHVTAQQAYSLLELERGESAVMLVRQAREEASSKIPSLLRSWLWAAEAEALASTGSEQQARGALEMASDLLPSESRDPELPFVFLDAHHLARWRGHCLARLGASEAVDELSGALDGLDPTFTRAAAGLHCDLALAYSVRGEHDAARAEAQRSTLLASQTASARQRRRLSRLLESGAHQPSVR